MSNSLNDQKQGSLQREVGFWGLIFFGLLFMGPASGLVFFPSTEPWSGGSSYLGYIIATVVIILTVLSYQKMVVIFPESGSAYSYATKGINGKVGFIVGWLMMLDYALLPMFSFKLTAMYFNGVFPVIPVWLFVLLVGAFVICSTIFGVKIGIVVQMVIGVFALFFVCFFSYQAGHAILASGHTFFEPQYIYKGDQVVWRGVFQTAALAILCYVGFDGITTLTEESKIPIRKLSMTLMITVLLQAVFLIGTVYLASAAMDWKTIPEDSLGTAYLYMLTVWTSPVVAGFLSICNKGGSIALQIASVTAASRLIYCMGREGVLPKRFFGFLHPKTNTPTNAILLMGIICIVGALTLDWALISEVVSFGACAGFISVNVSVIVYFWIKKNEQGHVMRNLILPALGALAILYIMSTLSKACLTVGITWLVVGLIYFFINYSNNEAFRNSINKGVEGF